MDNLFICSLKNDKLIEINELKSKADSYLKNVVRVV